MNLIDRKTDRATLTKLMSAFPVTAILGLPQCGKRRWLERLPPIPISIWKIPSF
jgi:hypothetical protein